MLYSHFKKQYQSYAILLVLMEQFNYVVVCIV